jgi:hypothetical protein
MNKFLKNEEIKFVKNEIKDFTRIYRNGEALLRTFSRFSLFFDNATQRNSKCVKKKIE